MCPAGEAQSREAFQDSKPSSADWTRVLEPVLSTFTDIVTTVAPVLVNTVYTTAPVFWR